MDFQRTPGVDGQALSESYEVPSGLASPWGSGSYGVQISPDSSMVRPGTQTWLYPIGLVNASGISSSSDWSPLMVPGAGLVATLATTLSPSVTPLRGDSIVHVRFTRGACMKSLYLLRTYSLNYRMGVVVTIYDESDVPLRRDSFPWGLQVQGQWVNVSYTSSNVWHIKIEFTGFGYGAIRGFSACYPNTNADSCGICGGNSTSCGPAGPQPGQACFNASMTNPACQAGTYDQELRCVPTAYMLHQEVCNGVDDDCDGVIDNGASAVNVTCGVGACQRVVWGCVNGTDGSDLACVPGSPTAEVCNGIDDDCDGIVDNPPVCAQPVQGVAVVPVALCVEGRISASSVQCYAHFGWWNSDQAFNVTRPYGSDMNVLSVSPENPDALKGVPVPSFFAANGSVEDAFRVPIPCQGGAAIWSLGDGLDHFLEAAVYAISAPPCENYVGLPDSIARPITVFVDSPCVQRETNGTRCTVTLGYYNPNYGAPAYYVPARTAQNMFFVDEDASGASIPIPPATFFQQRVREAVVVEWPCPRGTETLRWQLQTAGVTHQAVVSASLRCQD